MCSTSAKPKRTRRACLSPCTTCSATTTPSMGTSNESSERRRTHQLTETTYRQPLPHSAHQHANRSEHGVDKLRTTNQLPCNSGEPKLITTTNLPSVTTRFASDANQCMVQRRQSTVSDCPQSQHLIDGTSGCPEHRC